jgi:hypothetical protein
MQPYSYPTGRNMEDDLNIFVNGRQPRYFKGRQPHFLKMEDDQTKKCNQKQIKVKIIIFLKMEDDLNKSKNNGCGTASGNIVFV